MTNSSSVYDVVDQAASLDDGSTTHALRHAREKATAIIQGSYDASFDADVPGLTLGERLLVASYACRLTPTSELAEHYRARLTSTSAGVDALQIVDHSDIDTLTDACLRAILTFTCTLAEYPIEGDCDVLLCLPAAGLATVDVVTLTQLTASMSYQTWLVAGLRVFRGAAGSGSTTAPTEAAA